MALHGWATADHGLAPKIGGVRRQSLVRFDRWTSTWQGHDAEGQGALVRVVRPHVASDPVVLRWLARDASWLQPLCSTLTAGAGWLSCELPGEAAEPGHRDQERAARSVGHLIQQMKRWGDAGLSAPTPVLEELRDTDDGLVLATLTPAANTVCGVLRRAAETVTSDGPIGDALILWQTHPPELEEAIQQWQRALATMLTARRHGLLQRWYGALDGSRRMRLYDATLRLGRAVPPPMGRGVVGVDLDGTPLVIVSDGTSVVWRGDERLYDRTGGFAAAAARRVLRTRASAPLSARLHAEHDADTTFTDNICTWIAAALKLRTIGMLLHATEERA
jgi:hypothetical protein